MQFQNCGTQTLPVLSTSLAHCRSIWVQIAAMTTVEEAEEKADSESDADSFGKEFEEMLEDSDDEVGRIPQNIICVLA